MCGLRYADLGHEHNREPGPGWTTFPVTQSSFLALYTDWPLAFARLPIVMGEAVLTLGKAWNVYDEWLEDPRVEFTPSRATSILPFAG